MKSGISGLVLAVVGLSFVLPVRAQAQGIEPFLGTWVMNPAKSTTPPGPPSKGNTNKLEAVGKGFHFVEENVDAKGTVMKIEYTVESFDGKDYPWKATMDGKPMPIGDAIAFKKIDDRTYELEDKMGGKVTMTQKWVLSKDGKTRTTTMNMKQAPAPLTLVYEKK
jgi:hypothetical protein